MFNNVLNSVKSLMKSGDKKEAINKLKEALSKAALDNALTVEELAEVQKLQKELNITEEEMHDIKIDLLEILMEKISADGIISEEEIKVFNQMKTSLGVDLKIELDKEGITKEDLKKGFEEVKGFLSKLKKKTIEIGDKVYDKTKEMIKHDKPEDKKETPK
jgi:hypothetical protein